VPVIWIAKTFRKYANWAADQDVVERLQLAVAATGHNYSQVMMTRVYAEGDHETIYIGLPHRVGLLPPACSCDERILSL
jgi:hypothetical protein